MRGRDIIFPKDKLDSYELRWCKAETTIFSSAEGAGCDDESV